ncbi:dienelactone hydrolase family protein [Alsobacter sp. SYSU BS001988]
MPGRAFQIPSTGGGQFGCYLASPIAGNPSPAVVLASSILGVNEDIRAIADEFADNGYVAAAPDLFWRSIPGPLQRGSGRAAERAQPRRLRITIGEADMSDTLSFVANLPECNGRAMAMGFCYGGPYAIIGPGRLGYSAGLSCHGSDMLDYIEELEEGSKPIRLLWGDRDNRAPPEVLDKFIKLAIRTKNLKVHILPRVHHGYMMPSNQAAFSHSARKFSIACALGILSEMRRERKVEP